MTSKHISRTSAIVLLIEGVALLFAPELVLGRLVPGLPDAALFLGQLVGAGWLGVAALNWLSQRSTLGGIYGRPVVAANVATHFIGALVLIDAATGAGAEAGLWVLTAPAILLAGVYGWLLLCGPLRGELEGRGER